MINITDFFNSHKLTVYVALGLILTLFAGGVYVWNLQTLQDNSLPSRIEIEGRQFEVKQTTRSVSDTSDWLLFEDQDFGMSFTYPQEWNLTSSKSSIINDRQNILFQFPDTRIEQLYGVREPRHAFTLIKFTKPIGNNYDDVFRWMHDYILDAGMAEDVTVDIKQDAYFEATTLNDRITFFDMRNVETSSPIFFPEKLVVSPSGTAYMFFPTQDHAIFQDFGFGSQSNNPANDLVNAMISTISFED
jgi:hypothetical protein